MEAVIPGLIFVAIGLAVGLGGWFTLADIERAAVTLRATATVRDPDKHAELDLYRRRAKILGWAAVGAGILIFLLGAIDAIRALVLA